MLRPRKAVILALTFMATAMTSASELQYQPAEVLVKYKEGTMRTRSSMNVLYDALRVVNVRRYTGIMRGLEHLTVESQVDVQDAIRELQKSNVVEYAQPNYILHALPIAISATRETNHADPVGKTPCLFPGLPIPPGCKDQDPSDNQPARRRPDLRAAPEEVIPEVKDPYLKKNYGLSQIGATDAWAIHKGDKKFIVADIDTGIDYNHEDLAFNLWRNPNPSEKKDIVGFDFIHNDGLPYDDNEHGTHTAGTIGAVGNNGVGISGVAQRVSVMALKFLSGDGTGTTSDAIRAIDYAVSHGAKVLNNSWGGKGDPDNLALREAIERARTKDVLFIAAAGNDGMDNDGSDPEYPAAFETDNIIAVAATDQSDYLAFFSNYGKVSTHVAAPGVDIYSTTPNGKYGALSGTSMASPHVAGAAALLWSLHPDWNYKKIKEVLIKTVDTLSDLSDKVASGGRINVLKAINYSPL